MDAHCWWFPTRMKQRHSALMVFNGKLDVDTAWRIIGIHIKSRTIREYQTLQQHICRWEFSKTYLISFAGHKITQTDCAINDSTVFSEELSIRKAWRITSWTTRICGYFIQFTRCGLLDWFCKMWGFRWSTKICNFCMVLKLPSLILLKYSHPHRIFVKWSKGLVYIFRKTGSKPGPSTLAALRAI